MRSADLMAKKLAGRRVIVDAAAVETPEIETDAKPAHLPWQATMAHFFALLIILRVPLFE